MADNSAARGRLSRLICRDLAERIRANAFPTGTLPSEEALAAEYGASRVSVREALAALQNMDYLARGQGRSARINTLVTGLPCRISEGRPFDRLLAAQGWQVSAQSSAIRPQPAPPEVLARLPGAGETRFCMDKVFSADGQPVIYVRNYYSPACADPRLLAFSPEELSRRSLFDILSQLALPEIVRDLIEVIPLSAPAEVAGRLALPPSAALLLFRSLAVDAEQRPLLLNLEYYHPRLCFQEVRHTSYY